MKKPDTPKTIAGTAKWQRFPSLRRMWMRQRRLLVVVAAAVLLVVLGAIIWWVEFSGETSQPPIAIGNGYEKSLQDLQAQTVPKEPIDQVYYYSQLGQNNRALQRYKPALDYYLKAQTVVDANNLSERASFYESIADMHDKLGHKIEAGIYRKRAEDRIKNVQTGDTPSAQESAWE